VQEYDGNHLDRRLRALGNTPCRDTKTGDSQLGEDVSRLTGGAGKTDQGNRASQEAVVISVLYGRDGRVTHKLTWGRQRMDV